MLNKIVGALGQGVDTGHRRRPMLQRTDRGIDIGGRPLELAVHRTRIVIDPSAKPILGGDPCDGRAKSHPLHHTGDVEANPYGHRNHGSRRVLPMHELSLCRAIAGVVKSHAGERRVDVVRVRVGALRQVVPDSLAFCWTIVRDDEDMPDAELELEFVTAEVHCLSCGKQSEIESRFSVACPQCTSADVTVVHGEEFLVTSVDVT